MFLLEELKGRGIPDRTNVNIRAIDNLSTEMRKLRAQIKEQNEVLIRKVGSSRIIKGINWNQGIIRDNRTLTATNDHTMKLFDTWEKTMEKMYSKNRRTSSCQLCRKNGRRLCPNHTNRSRRDRINKR